MRWDACLQKRKLRKEEGGKCNFSRKLYQHVFMFSPFKQPSRGLVFLLYKHFFSSFPALATPRHVCCRCFPLLLVSLKLLVGQVLQHLHGRQGVRHQPKEDKGDGNREGGEVVRE